MKARRRLNKAEYANMEAFVEAHPHGPAFLRQRDLYNLLLVAEELRQSLREIAKPADAERSSQMRQELVGIQHFIEQTRQEIAALSPDNKGNSQIVLATSELDAIVSATERATTEILNRTEMIQAAADRLPKAGDAAPIVTEIGNHIIEIMTACSFQDLTGQRTARVVNALRYIERRVNAMIDIWGIDPDSERPKEENQDQRPDAHLMNGPSLSGGVSQGDVDSMFAPGLASETVTQDAINDLFS